MSHPVGVPEDAIVANYIGGQWLTSSRPGESREPATGDVLGRFYDADVEQVDEAIRVARDVFTHHEWKDNRELRATALFELATAFEHHRGELVALLARENGKIVPEAEFELSLVAPKLRYYAALALADTGRAAEARPGVFSMALRQPIGVAGVIVPWNSPVILAVRSFAPALAAGCTAVVKLPAQTALVNHAMARVVAEAASLPAGVLNLFTESGDEGAKRLVQSDQVNVVSYTGSTQVGRKIMEAASASLKRLSLELGGKTPMIVFDDADLDRVVPTLVKGITTFSGQFCMTGSRILVQAGIAAQVRERLASALEKVVVGPGDDPASEMGPMIDMANARRVEAIVADAAPHAEVIVRGGPVEDGPLSRGAYHRPTLLGVDDIDSPLIQRELFGPVATFEVFDDEADAVRRANATEYGLAASVWTAGGDRALRVARELEAGTVWCNAWAVVLDQFEEGGFKQSGLGRLNGVRGLEEFQEIKHLVQVSG